MPCRQHQHREVVISNGCSGCATLDAECRSLQRRVDKLQRQLLATANLQALLAAKDRELAACRARLGRYEGPTKTTWCDSDVEDDGEATTTVQDQRSTTASQF